MSTDIEPGPPARPPDVWTIGRLVTWTAKYLAQKGSEFPRLDTEVLLAHALGCERIQLYTRYDEPTSDDVRAAFRELVRRRVDGCPVAYLVGRKEFFSLRFDVGPDVLIPRQDTEVLVVECLRLATEVQTPRVLDVGTGSGNIAVTVARRLPTARVTAIDLSPAALEIAAANATRHHVNDRIRFLAGDLFGPLEPGERFDFILSNPPYIPSEDLPTLPVGVREFEPHLALDGGPGGYVTFDRLTAGAADRLDPGGRLIIEIGSPQEVEARARLEALGRFDLAPTIIDHAGHPRVLSARLKPTA